MTENKKWKVQHRWDTAANWRLLNPVLLAGEKGIVSDSPSSKREYRVGDGKTPWNDLPASFDWDGKLPKVPTTLAELAEDETHRTVTDAEKEKWNTPGQAVDVPTKLSQLAPDTLSQHFTKEEKDKLAGLTPGEGGKPSVATNYSELAGKPQIDGHEIMSGNQTAESLSLATSNSVAGLKILKSKYNGDLIKIVGENKISVDTDNYIIFGRNIFDESKIVKNKRKDDSGNVVSDSNNYLEQYIPVKPGMKIISSFNIQRVYNYTKNKTFIKRDIAVDAIIPYQVPADTYYLQIQLDISVNYTNGIIEYGDSVGIYTPYQENSDGDLYPISYVVANDRQDISVSVIGYIAACNSLDGDFSTFPTTKVVRKIAEADGLKQKTISKNGKLIIVPNEKLLSYTATEKVIVVGENIFDSSTRVVGKIKNDQNEEVVDGVSNYYSQYIPVYGHSIVANFKIQRVYLFNEQKELIERRAVDQDGGYVINVDSAAFVQIQIALFDLSDGVAANLAIWFSDAEHSSEYKAYTQNPGADEKTISFFSSTSEQVSIELTILCKHIFPEIGDYPFLEPTNVPTDKSCPIGSGTQSIDYTYQQLLTDYYDPYIYQQYADGYTVTKRGLGNDSANDGHEIFEYVFAPKYYNKTILLSAGMNACELSGEFGLAIFIRDLMSHQEDGMKALYESTRFVVIPCECPSCLDSRPIKYTTYNNVRINKNWNHKDSWKQIGELYPSEPKGEYPDSEIETLILKKWVNKYTGANLWIDCHSDAGSTGENEKKNLCQVIASDKNTVNIVKSTFGAIRAYYKNKGFFTEDSEATTSAWITGIAVYPKTLYSKEVCNIPAFMIEQYICSKTYGSDGQTNNDEAGIKNYAALLRYYILAFCKSTVKIV